MKILRHFDQKGGVWMGVWTAVMVPMAVASFILNKEFPSTLVQLYLGVLAVFGASKAVVKLKGPSKNA